jgi:uncharacterized membrane protein
MHSDRNREASDAQSRAAADREYARVARLLDAAERRMGESWDKPRGVQDRVARTVAKHRATLRRLEAKRDA